METWNMAGATRMNGRARPRWLRLTSLLLAIVFVGFAFSFPVFGEEADTAPYDEGATTASEAGWQAASLLSTIPYGLAKLGVALAGGLGGGVGYVFSGGDKEGAEEIWSMFMGGTYVLTPAHLKGEEPIRFIVEKPESEESQQTSESPLP